MDSILYTTDGERRIVTPSNGTDFSLEELQQFVGGYIEIIRLSGNRLMIINEEGKVWNLPLNCQATMVYQKEGKIDVIVGNALVCGTDKIK